MLSPFGKADNPPRASEYGAGSAGRALYKMAARPEGERGGIHPRHGRSGTVPGPIILDAWLDARARNKSVRDPNPSLIFIARVAAAAGRTC